jgi:hypothetical protein
MRRLQSSVEYILTYEEGSDGRLKNYVMRSFRICALSKIREDNIN